MSTYRAFGLPTLLVCWLAASGNVFCADVEGPQIVERGFHHRVWEKIETEVLPDGSTVARKRSYTELSPGLYYRNEQGEWAESREEVEVFNGSAVARHGRNQVIFAANLNSPGAIDMLSPDGKRFRSHILGLAYTDAATGRSVLIAETRDCLGAVLPPNQVIYQNAFAGDCQADVRYTYTKAGFEQDIILLNAPPSPGAWGMDPETTRLEVFTEFVEAPEALVTSVVLKQEPDALRRQQMVEPDLVDQQLDFGEVKIGAGQAFPLGQVELFDESRVDTGKSLTRIDGRLFLIEKVDYAAIRGHLQRLPQAAAVGKDRKVAEKAQLAGILPTQPKGQRGQWKEKQVAQVSPRRQGLVMDYIAVTGALTNYTFQGDTTYHITGTPQFFGTTIVEGGTVLKYNANTQVQFFGPVDCRTSAYRPAFFTAKDDDTIGELVSGSSGNPGYGTAAIALAFKDSTVTYDVHDFKVYYAQTGVAFYNNTRANVRNVVVGKGLKALVWVGVTEMTWRNFLFYDVTNAFFASATITNRMEQGTFHRIQTLRNAPTNSTVLLTNCLLICVTNGMLYYGANNATNIDDTGIFQTVGAGSHYLANNSTNRNAGTTNINTDLLAALKQRTTYPPLVLSNHITGDVTLIPQAQRDTDTPDIGYHYDPLDFVASQTAITNATLTLSAGTALGVYGATNNNGLVLLDGARFISEGTPDNLNRIVRYNLVQEQATTNWSASTVGRSVGTPMPYAANFLPSEVRLRFTEWGMPAYGNDHFYAGATNLTLSIQDCQFKGGQFASMQPNLTLLNSLFDRVLVTVDASSNAFTALVRNCTFSGGKLTAQNNVSASWGFTNNLIDTGNLVQSGTIGNNFNAYLTNATRLTPNGGNDVLLTASSITYDQGTLGRFYLPTNLTSHNVLFDSGSAAANNLGLYHFTTTTNQVKETNSTVDIGFHYVSVNSSGQPIDTDGDGLADYSEDADGDGTLDSGETDWNDPADWGLRVFITRPRNGSNLP